MGLAALTTTRLFPPATGKRARPHHSALPRASAHAHTRTASKPHHISLHIHHLPNSSYAARISDRGPRSAPRALFSPSPRPGCTPPPLTARPPGSPLPPQLLAVCRPHRAATPRINPPASPWRIWLARIAPALAASASSPPPPRHHSRGHLSRNCRRCALSLCAFLRPKRSRSTTLLRAAPHSTSQRGSPPRTPRTLSLFDSL